MPSSKPSTTQARQRTCANCKQACAADASICPQCGIPMAPERTNTRTWHGISFPMFVIITTIFCAIMILWLPR